MNSPILKYLKFILNNKLRNRFELTIFVTNKCNASCKHCFYNSQLNSKTPELDSRYFKSIAETIPSSCKRIIFSGGEPFLHPELLEITKIFSEKGVREFTIVTNGILTDKIASFVDKLGKLENTKLTIAVSLDGPQEVHDSIRGHEGAFQKAIQTLELLNMKNANFEIQTVLSCLNLDNIDPFDQYIFERFGKRVHYQILRGTELSGLPKAFRNDFNPSEEKLLPSENEMRRIISVMYKIFLKRMNHRKSLLNEILDFTILESKYFIAKRNKRIFPCVAGIKRGVIYPSGETAICEYIKPAKKGLSDYGFNFMQLWNSEEIIAQKRIAEKCFCTHGCFIDMIGTFRFLLYFTRNFYRFLSSSLQTDSKGKSKIK